MQSQPHFEIDDTVRHKLERAQFQKGNAQWSKAVYKIVDKTTHSYILNNGKACKAYDLQRATETEGPKTIQN